MNTTRDKTSERVEGPTPNGGVYSIAYFFNSEHKPCSKQEAAEVRVNEYDRDDKEVASSMMRKKATK